MKVQADRSKCQGHSLCHNFAPEVFPVDDDGYIEVDEISVLPGDEGKANRGVAMCPERALVSSE